MPKKETMAFSDRSDFGPLYAQVRFRDIPVRDTSYRKPEKASYDSMPAFMSRVAVDDASAPKAVQHRGLPLGMEELALKAPLRPVHLPHLQGLSMPPHHR